MPVLKAGNTLGVVFFPAFDWSISPTHPERQERLLYTMDQLKEEGVFDTEGITEFKPEVATFEDVERTHFCFPGPGEVLTDSHLIAAGGAIKASDLVLGGTKKKSFALVRPPGHHAMKVVHGNRGFCSVNNEAVMIERLRDHYGVRRVAVVDTDCHHGDGTQDIYWHDPDTLFISLHQDGRTLFPGSGFPNELGGPQAAGTTINIPLPPGTSDTGILHVLDNLILPMIEDFKPELVINSAGQDNHYTDPLTDMNFSAQGYAELSRRLDPDIAVLEGGYAIQGALPYVNLGIVLALAGMDFSHVREPDYDPGRIRQSRQIDDYLPKLCEAILEIYHHPPDKLISREKQGGWWVRSKEIFYDTDGIRDRQKEYVRVCGECMGLLKVETSSSRLSGCLGIEVPRQACESCRDHGQQELRRARESGSYQNIQLIDRPGRRSERFTQGE